MKKLAQIRAHLNKKASDEFSGSIKAFEIIKRKLRFLSPSLCGGVSLSSAVAFRVLGDEQRR